MLFGGLLNLMNRHKQREFVFLLLFENNFTGYSLEELRETKVLLGERLPGDFNDFVVGYFEGILENLAKIDEIIEKFSLKWGKNRLSKIALAILRLSVYEMLYREDIPTNVAINEAVELSKKYGAEKEPAFINGILGGINKDLEQKNG